MNRRSFLRSTAAASGILLASKSVAAAPNMLYGTSQHKIKPPRLKLGDTIALICPAGFITEKDLEEAQTNMRSLGFNPVPGNYVLQKNGYLAGTDAQRADDINSAFRDKNINGIFCIRGGYGCARLLHLLDYEMIANNPKVLIGYSDVTSLLYALYSKSGLICFHGPVATSTFNEFSVTNFSQVCMSNNVQPLYYPPSEAYEKDESKPYTIRTGTATGELIGGNLSVAVSIANSEYDVDTKSKILFFEEVREDPYRIDRMLTQLLLNGSLANASGIMLGVFSKCEPGERSEKSSFMLKEVLMDRLYQLNIPVAYGFPFGHVVNKLTLPIGVRVTIDTMDMSMKLEEPAVL